MRAGAYSLLAALALLARTELPARAEDLDTKVMRSAIKLSHPDSTGTAFILTRPDPDDPKTTRYILATAEHVLSRMKGEEATLDYRKAGADGGDVKCPAKVKIRKDGKGLWTRHPTADVAVMALAPPPDVSPSGVPVALLATDADLARYEIHPGDSIRCVGFPHPNQFEANESGYGLVRAGCIASYPLLPTGKTKTFLFDLNTFEGDSGAPVYVSEDRRVYGESRDPGQVRMILGLVTGQHFLDEELLTVTDFGGMDIGILRETPTSTGFAANSRDSGAG